MSRKQETSAPRPGFRPGDLEFRFRRSGYVLSIDVVKPTYAWWLTVSIQMRKSEPSQPVFLHERMDKCRLTDSDNGPSLHISGASFALRPDEYSALREHVSPLGLTPFMPTDPRARANASDRTFGGEIEGCGGDAELDRMVP